VGLPRRGGHAMSYSLNEVEALSKRAARGAGLDWGLAEEAAKASRWLCAQGFDGCRVLANLLTADHVAGRPVALEGEWHAANGSLCPVRTGAALSDCATQVGAQGVKILDLAHPLFILPFVAAAARKTNANLQIHWSGVTITTNGHHVDLTASTDGNVYVEQVEHIEITLAPCFAKSARHTVRAKPHSLVLDQLNSLAALTYAPATEASRRLGAGAGQSDND